MTITVTDAPTDWYASGACRDLPADWFHPERGESTTNAKSVCTICPVRVPCLDWALTNHEKFGIWGGTSERERRRIKRRMLADQAIPELTDDWAPKFRWAAAPAPLPSSKEARPVELTVTPPIPTPAEPPATNGNRAEQRTDACVNCGVRYTPSRRDQRFHSKECARAWYANHPRGEGGIRKARAARTPRKQPAVAVAPPAPLPVPATPDTPGSVDLQALLGQLLAGCDNWTIEANLGDVHITVSRGDR